MLRRTLLRTSLFTMIAARLGFWPASSKGELVANAGALNLIDNVKPGDVAYFESNEEPLRLLRFSVQRRFEGSQIVLTACTYWQVFERGHAFYRGKLLFSDQEPMICQVDEHTGEKRCLPFSEAKPNWGQISKADWADFAKTIRIVTEAKTSTLSEAPS